MGYKIMNINNSYGTVAINTHYSHDNIIKSSKVTIVDHPPKEPKVQMDKKISDIATQQNKLDEVVEALENEGVTLNNYKDKSEGLGDVIGNIFTKLGVTEETVEKWSGIGGCGCQKRKKFLNKIIPFRNKA